VLAAVALGMNDDGATVIELVRGMGELQRRFACDRVSVVYELNGQVMTVSLSDRDVLTFERDDGHRWSVPVGAIE
jgi:hypothetical protein